MPCETARVFSSVAATSCQHSVLLWGSCTDLPSALVPSSWCLREAFIHRCFGVLFLLSTSDLQTRKKYVGLVEAARDRGARVFVFSRLVCQPVK